MGSSERSKDRSLVSLDSSYRSGFCFTDCIPTGASGLRDLAVIGVKKTGIFFYHCTTVAFSLEAATLRQPFTFHLRLCA
jgi:hypothetical protein